MVKHLVLFCTVVVVFLVMKTSFSSVTSAQHIRGFNRGVFRTSSHELYNKLPEVHIIHMTSQFNSSSENIYPLKPGNIEHLFFEWLNTSFVKKDLLGEHASLFFLFTLYPKFIQPHWWLNLDRELQKLAQQSSLKGFQLDRVFMPYFYDHLEHRRSDDGWRNILDLRMLRPDCEWSLNGREVFIPYIVKSGEQDRNLLSPKNWFISGLCLENESGLDSNRNWTSKLFTQWKDVPNTILYQSQNDSQMNQAYRSSDFCVILPGETSSSSELYKAIFAGCIPVIFVAFKEQLPFFHFLDWSKFAVIIIQDIINSKNEMKELIILLRGIKDDLVLFTSYKTNVFEAAPLFDYGRWEWPSVYHLTLLELTHGRQCGSPVRGSLFEKYQLNSVSASSNLGRFIC
jgi:hypothetical protein